MAMLGTGGAVELARPLTRLVARIIDGAILILVSLIPVLVGLYDLDDFTDEPLGLSLALTAVGLAYEVALVATRGQTLGKMAMKIKIIRASDGLLPGWDMSTVRWLVPAVPGLVGLAFSLGLVELLSLVVYLSLTWDKVRQGWHDKAAKTLVIKVLPDSAGPIREGRL
ncbi:MAG: RDD family protein [Acidimicrobiaceae bacterium]|nr:RDD family protein [Acidimicrobiaceae bacterium]MXY09370.1 RDD family protein [Acidimicrobiaceae bacterium]MXZ66701.1 RDD family protein [Acidimicrobiaceae bacterium]MYA15016.1 RDD family protein [Acidimicrobiaceae bacterium]MYF33273.1 RDD family protein [Acidimicrobiaceae bacterium]